MSVELPSAQQWAKRARGRRIHAGGAVLGRRTAARYRCANLDLSVRSGTPDGRQTLSDGIIELTADASVWDKILAAVPERFHNDVMANVMQSQGIERKADRSSLRNTLRQRPAPLSSAAGYRCWRGHGPRPTTRGHL